jgi:hypothetical protein
MHGAEGPTPAQHSTAQGGGGVRLLRLSVSQEGAGAGEAGTK